MGPFEMVVLIVFIATAGKVADTLASRLGGRGGVGEERIRALEAELRANEARVVQTEEQVAQLGEKLGFVEALLAQPARPVEISAPPPPPDTTPMMRGEAPE